MLPKRGNNSTSEGSGDRIVTSFLTEMDGIFSNSHQQGVFIIAVSSHKDSIDPAILRPGRLDIHVQLTLPDLLARRQILEGALKEMPNDLADSDFENLARQTDGKSSGDLINMCREAAMGCIRNDVPILSVKYLASLVSNNQDI